MKFVLTAYGSRGDAEPFAAVGRELLQRGHDVTLAVAPNMVGFVESAGLPAISYGPDAREEMNPARELVAKLSGQGQNPLVMLAEIAAHVNQVNADKIATLISLTDGADLLAAGVNEQNLAANVAESRGIPLAALHAFPARLWASGGMSSLVSDDADQAQRRQLGLPEQPASSPRRIALEIQGYDAFCLPGPAAVWVEPDDRRPFVGALTLEAPTDTDDEVLSWIADGTPPIYFGFGSTPIPSLAETVAVLSAACARLGERALIAGGANDFTDVPQFDHVKVVGEVNHAVVFPACRAVVHHGGAGTTAAGMRAGVPTLIMWFWLDQPVWADGVTRLEVGLGRQFMASTLDSLVADLRSVLAPPCVSRARDVAAQMTQPAKSVANAADLLEDTARAGRVD